MRRSTHGSRGRRRRGRQSYRCGEPETSPFLAGRLRGVVRPSRSAVQYARYHSAENYIVASLSPEFATDLILRRPADRPYDTLKQQLITRTADSEQRRLQQLFRSEELGDRKPSQLLRRMQQLLGDKAAAADGAFLRELFLQRLPSNVRIVLASTNDAISLEELAQLADKIMDVASPSVSVITTPPLHTEVDQLRAEVFRLKELVSYLPFSAG